MSTTTKILIGAVLAGAIGYVIYRNTVPPAMQIITLNPLDGTGTFSWGKSGGALGPGTFQGGWGWSAVFSGFTPGTGWNLQVMHGGVLHRNTVVSMPGTVNL